MAFAVKYRLEFDSLPLNGVDKQCKLDIYVDGFVGSVTNLTGTGNPVIIRWEHPDENDKYRSILGSQLTVNVYSESEEEFVGLYGSRGRIAYCIYYEDSNQVWKGWLNPQDYQEPYVYIPYPVSLRFTDGLGDLRNEKLIEPPYLAVGINPNVINTKLRNILFDALFGTGLNLGFEIKRGLINDSVDFEMFDTTYLDYRNFLVTDGQRNSYDCLFELLYSLGYRVTQSQGKWVVYYLDTLHVTTDEWYEYDSDNLPVGINTKSNTKTLTGWNGNPVAAWNDQTQMQLISPAWREYDYQVPFVHGQVPIDQAEHDGYFILQQFTASTGQTIRFWDDSTWPTAPTPAQYSFIEPNELRMNGYDIQNGWSPPYYFRQTKNLGNSLYITGQPGTYLEVTVEGAVSGAVVGTGSGFAFPFVVFFEIGGTYYYLDANGAWNATPSLSVVLANEIQIALDQPTFKDYASLTIISNELPNNFTNNYNLDVRFAKAYQFNAAGGTAPAGSYSYCRRFDVKIKTVKNPATPIESTEVVNADNYYNPSDKTFDYWYDSSSLSQKTVFKDSAGAAQKAWEIYNLGGSSASLEAIRVSSFNGNYGRPRRVLTGRLISDLTPITCLLDSSGTIYQPIYLEYNALMQTWDGRWEEAVGGGEFNDDFNSDFNIS